MDDEQAKLKERISVPDETLDLIASHAAETGGDCRRAFDLLLRAGQRAEEEQIQEVTPRMVKLDLGTA